VCTERGLFEERTSAAGDEDALGPARKLGHGRQDKIGRRRPVAPRARLARRVVVHHRVARWRLLVWRMRSTVPELEMRFHTFICSKREERDGE
jgi:hypothetical protein